MNTLQHLDFEKGDGLLPAVVQHAESGQVLMLGYMNSAALEATLSRGRLVLFSRSKGRLWEKGEISGHSLQVEKVIADCDRDTLLVKVWPRGPTCHLGTASCFGDGTVGGSFAFLGQLEKLIAERMQKKPEGSYTAKLLAKGQTRVAQKVGEEGLEVALAAASGTDQEVISEVADLLYHLLVMLNARGLTFGNVVEELQARHTARAHAQFAGLGSL
jgi:phosphoribosyl-AMP cyclohydrolase / phosphoribosyl-ATP pyrophosphohydrolase